MHVEFISTLAAARGRGVGLRDHRRTRRSPQPELPALLIASDLGKPVYDRLGYLTIARFTLWAGHRGHE